MTDALVARREFFQIKQLTEPSRAMLGGLLALCKLYWFKNPFIGVSISFVCYVASIVASQV